MTVAFDPTDPDPVVDVRDRRLHWVVWASLVGVTTGVAVGLVFGFPQGRPCQHGGWQCMDFESPLAWLRIGLSGLATFVATAVVVVQHRRRPADRNEPGILR